jgi:plasmid maintenance system antidote protein VapI
MALRLEKAFGVSMDTLLRSQLAFDIAKARRLSKSIHVRKWSPPKRNGAPKRAARQSKNAKTVSR